MQEQFSESLFIPRERGKGPVQLRRHLCQLRAILLERLQPFIEVGIHVIGIDESGINFGEVTIQFIWRFRIIVHIIIWVTTAIAIAIEQFFIALRKNEVRTFVNLRTHHFRLAMLIIVLIRIVSIRAIDLVFRGAPVKALHFRRFKVPIQFHELLGKLTPAAA